MDPGSSAAATGTVYGAIALVVIALVPALRDLIGYLRARTEHRWKSRTNGDQPEHTPDDDTERDLPPDVVWLHREISRLERELVRCRREGERYLGEVEQLRGEVEFLVEQLQEAVEERDLAHAREAKLRAARRDA